MKAVFSLLILLMSAGAQAQNYVPVESGSKIHFVIKNFGINTGGDFTGLAGRIVFDAKNPAAAQFNVTVDAKTVDTDNGSRDEHLRSDDFFDVAKYPQIRISSTSIIPGKDLFHFTFRGTLTIRNVTKPVEFPFTAGKLSDGSVIFKGDFEINRLDFGVGSESATMSDKVKVSLSVAAKNA